MTNAEHERTGQSDADPSSREERDPRAKTPLYEAHHAARYHRQSLIREIQRNTGRRLISYVSGSSALIDRDDKLGFVDLLHHATPSEDIDLLLHTGGGDIDAAEKLIGMVRDTVRTAVLRVVVPDFAKSAGTLMALGADAIVMSDSSELGPIDPQVAVPDANGNRFSHSVFNYLDAYERFTEALAANPDDPTARLMLSKMDAHMVVHMGRVRDRALQLAEQLLSRGMMRDGGNWTQAAASLLDTSRWLSHGQMISWEDAQDPKVGLTVEYMPPPDPVWQNFWRLYCLQRLAIGDKQKLFESDIVSLPIDGR